MTGRAAVAAVAAVAMVALAAISVAPAGCGGRSPFGVGDGGDPPDVTADVGDDVDGPTLDFPPQDLPVVPDRPPPDLPGPDLVTHCRGLDEIICRTRNDLGCSVVYCTDCNRNRFYVGCAGPDSPIVCTPPSNCQLGCRDDTMCGNTELCLAPGGSPGCGTCFQPTQMPCQSDADCGQSGVICEPLICACDTGTYCTPGCSRDQPCPEGQECGADFRCRPQPCGTGCPFLFTCTSGVCAEGQTQCCQRDGCQLDADCANGNAYCVEQLCYSEPGKCIARPQ
jgi:hypothetical protein